MTRPLEVCERCLSAAVLIRRLHLPSRGWSQKSSICQICALLWSYQASETATKANSHCLKALCFNGHHSLLKMFTALWQASVLHGRHIHRKYCMSDNSQVLSSTSKVKDWEWEVEISWQLESREDRKFSAQVCGARLWKFFWGGLIFQIYIGILGCPSCFILLPFVPYNNRPVARLASS